MAIDLLNMCSSCKQVEDPETGEWIDREDHRYDLLIEHYEGNISHGACDPCKEIQSEEIKYYEAKIKSNKNE